MRLLYLCVCALISLNVCVCVQNNIAEVSELHGELMVQSFLDHIRTLLHSPEVEVSYFAAGILAHLTSRGEKVWTLELTLRNTLLQQLVRVCLCVILQIDVYSEYRLIIMFVFQHSAILKWPTPECEMVAYR